MKINKYIGLVIASVFLIVYVLPGLVVATNIVGFVNGTNYSAGNYMINVSFQNDTDISGVTEDNSTCYHNASGIWTAFTGTTFLVNDTADTGNTNFLLNVTITSSLDSRGVAINCSVGNGTEALSITDKIIGVTFDSTSPNVLITRSPSSASYGATIDYKCKISDAIDNTGTIGVSTSPIIAEFNISNADGTNTNLTQYINDVTRGYTSTNTAGTYSFYCFARDFTGNNKSVSANVTIGELNSPVVIEGNGSGSNNSIIIIIIIGLILFWLFNKK